jgi:hypothetical protein
MSSFDASNALPDQQGANSLKITSAATAAISSPPAASSGDKKCVTLE